MKSKIKKINKKTPNKVIGRKVTIDELALMIRNLNNSIPLKIDKSIEDFAVAVGKGFAGVDARFDRVDEIMDKMDERLNRMEMKLDSLERRIFAIEDLLTEHRNILNEHGKDIKEIKEELKNIKKTGDNNLSRIIELDSRVSGLEARVAL